MKSTFDTTLYLILSASTAFAVSIEGQSPHPLSEISSIDILPRAASGTVSLTTHDSTGKATTFNIPIDNQIHSFGKLHYLYSSIPRLRL
jgi:hypothetical protein